LVTSDLTKSEEDETLFFVGSTFSSVDDVITDTISVKGPRVITFANILKYNIFPLAEILNEVLTIGKESFGSHVEIEFAVNLFKEKEIKPEFYLLQIRPMIVGRENVNTNIEDVKKDEAICMSNHSLGNGVYKRLYDIVYVDPEAFDSAKSRIIANEIGRINQSFINENKNYILIGFGRWGTSDPSLGIPVEWHQISKAKIVIESNWKDFTIDPSLGSHFFHNLTSLGMGYLHIPRYSEENFIEWEWIKEQEITTKGEYVRHIRLSKPLEVMLNALTSKGVILKPGIEKEEL
jgi:hypothetical protein